MALRLLSETIIETTGNSCEPSVSSIVDAIRYGGGEGIPIGPFTYVCTFMTPELWDKAAKSTDFWINFNDYNLNFRSGKCRELQEKLVRSTSMRVVNPSSNATCTLPGYVELMRGVIEQILQTGIELPEDYKLNTDTADKWSRTIFEHTWKKCSEPPSGATKLERPLFF